MPDDTGVLEETADAPEQTGSRLTPLQFPEGYIPGQYAPWYCSPEPIYGPDELGEYQNHIDALINNVNKCDAAARIWEVLQAWEMRLFRRNYHFLTAGWKGWGMFGGSSGTTGASILQSQNAMKLFSCNVLGARHKKIVGLLGRDVPGVTVTPTDDDDPMDQAAAEEAEKFKEVYAHQSDLDTVVKNTVGYFCTDDRVMYLTYTVADATRWGYEAPTRQQEAYGAQQSDGVTPETETAPVNEDGETPTRREITRVLGKLESKVPILSDSEDDMPWARAQWETGVNILKSMFPWVRDKIATQGNVGGMDQIDRMARINVRLAVQASSSSGEAYKNDATLTVTFLKPSEYEAVQDETVREVFYDEFPDGMEVWHAGGQLAMVRNCRMADHVKIIHPYPGDGQNREAILTNYLPLQKILNANISLIDRYFRGMVPRRFAREPFVNTEAINSQSNDPGKITPVYLPEGSPLRIPDITGVENVPSPNDAIFQFVQWLIQGGPEAMDGGSEAAFGGVNESQDQGVFRTTRLRRDQALQVFSSPWKSLCDGICTATEQAIKSAAANRLTDISASLPGQKKLQVEIEKLRGSVLVQPQSLEIPQTLAEQEEQMSELLEQSSNVALYQQIMLDPRNLAVFANFPTLRKLKIPGADAVEQQQGEFEILMRSGPKPNPQYQAIQQQIQQAEMDPEAQTPQGQMALQQLQQVLQAMRPEVSTVPVEEDTSENHMIHAAITLGFLTQATGRKLKYGNDEQKAIWMNFKLHWLEHMDMLKQLQQPPQVEMKATVTIDPTKLPPQAQAKAFQALGLQVTPDEVTPEDMTHEVTTEKEGVDAQGVPVKQKISVVGKPLNG